MSGTLQASILKDSSSAINNITLDASGNVAIGNNLTLSGAITLGNVAYTGSLTGSTGVIDIGSGQFYKTSGGNVGIGTATPAYKLSVEGSVAAGAVWSSVSNSNATAASTSGFIGTASGTNNYFSAFQTVGGSTTFANYGANQLYIFTNQAQPILFGTTATERMRIDSSGNVGIGGASPIAPKVRFQATSAAQNPVPTLGVASGTAYITNSDTAFGLLTGVTSAGPAWMQVQRTDATATAYDLLLQPSGGNVGIGASAAATKLTVNGAMALASPTTVNAATYTVLVGDSSLIFTTTNNVLTLPAAGTYPGRILHVKNVTATSVTSNATNVQPLGSATAGTAILAATAGKFAMLQSNGTNWVIMMAN